MRIVRLDHELEAFAVEDDEGSIGFDEAQLDNTRVIVNGKPVVFRNYAQDPDDTTKKLLGIE